MNALIGGFASMLPRKESGKTTGLSVPFPVLLLLFRYRSQEAITTEYICTGNALPFSVIFPSESTRIESGRPEWVYESMRIGLFTSLV